MKGAPAIFLAGAAVCLAVAMADQLSSGDLYSRGSTLRTDPEGTSAFAEALAKTGASVEKNYSPLGDLAGVQASILLLGVRPRELATGDLAASMMTLARSGTRVVIALDGEIYDPVKPEGWAMTIQNDANEEAAWPLYFESAPDWRVVRSVEAHAVAMERAFGDGAIALVSATRPFLNLSLRDDRDVELLAWTAGQAPRIVFDETHLGSNSGGTVVGLLRQFRLEWFLAVLVAASLLFFWRASVPFPPVEEHTADDGLHLSGGNAGETMRNLLERRIPPAGLMFACLQEWTRDLARRAGPELVREVSAAAASALPPKEQWEKIRGLVRGMKKR